MSIIKVRASIGKDWDPENWNGDERLDSDEAWDTEPQVFCASRSSPCNLKRLSYFPWGTHSAPAEAVALQDNADILRTHLHHSPLLLDQTLQ